MSVNTTTALPAIALELPHGRETAKTRIPTVATRRDLSGTYAYLFATALLANLYVLGLYLVFNLFNDPDFPACLATVNIFVAILVRNELFLNGLYRVLIRTCSSSTVRLGVKNGVTSTLLHIGGIHAGCAVACVLWLVVGMLHPASTGGGESASLAPVLCGSMLLLLAIMCITALPVIRDRYHDLFEFTHRFLGWSSLLLLWGYALLSVNWSTEAAGSGLLVVTARNVSLWLTACLAALIVSPWLSVRKVRVEARLHSASIVEITFGGKTGPGMFGRISRRPLADWHAFAVVSGEGMAQSHMMVISGVGDFTRELIADPPTALYTRRLKFPGLPYCVPMYQRSIIIATGAGMAPYLSLLPILPRGRHRLIWVGRSFREYFGDRVYEMALQWPDLVLIDTARSGRPDMTALAVEHYRDFGAEAVFVGSNPEGTSQIVSGCRALDIPAFGPSWDS
jgi:hypothetical protein